ncbi:MAG: hypothetical protein E7555_06365 [Ruminococcaceae bacterium]|nr:hypothetical protein [Oscillospiraceae bacterium]
MKAIGLDIGTTTVCTIVLDAENGKVIKSVTLPNDTFISDAKSFEKIQDPEKILKKALAMVDELLSEFDDVVSIGVTGQMHGLLYIDEKGEAVSGLYIWQDASANEIYKDGKTYAQHLTELTGYKMAAGFGAATYFYHSENNMVPASAVKICTIHDYAAMKLAGLKKTVMHTSDAASYGLFDIKNACFDASAIAKAGLKAEMFPDVTSECALLGKKNGNIPVSVAIGDNQASFLGSVCDIEDCLLVNVGTGSQISFSAKTDSAPSGLEIRPCIGDSRLMVGSSLCGGRAFALLENFFRETAELVTGEKCSSAYKGIDNFLENNAEPENPVLFSTLFCGTRENPEERASIENLGIDNFTPGHLVYGVMHGMANELSEMYKAGVSVCEEKPGQLIASGNGIRKNKTLQKIVSDIFGMELKIPAHKEEAAYGSAIFSLTSAGIYDTIQSALQLIQYES